MRVWELAIMCVLKLVNVVDLKFYFYSGGTNVTFVLQMVVLS